MAKIFEVNIELRHPGKEVRIKPYRIEVPLYSSIEWNIIYFEPDKWNFDALKRGLIYTVYFRKDSPFFWNRKSLHVEGVPRFSQSFPEMLTMKLAVGEAEKKGDYKYGVRISEDENDEVLYDEDPYIYVF